MILKYLSIAIKINEWIIKSIYIKIFLVSFNFYTDSLVHKKCICIDTVCVLNKVKFLKSMLIILIIINFWTLY